MLEETYVWRGESAVLQKALSLLRSSIGEQIDACPGFDFAENVLYSMTFRPEVTFKNPMAKFKARAEAGDFNELTEEELLDPDSLSPSRQPMDPVEFFDAKAAVIERSAIWNHAPDASISELWQNAWNMARLSGARAGLS